MFNHFRPFWILLERAIVTEKLSTVCLGNFLVYNKSNASYTLPRLAVYKYQVESFDKYSHLKGQVRNTTESS